MSVCRQFSHRTSVSNVIQWAEVSNSAYYYRHKANRPGRKPTMYTLKEDGTVVANEDVINDIKRTLQIEFVCYGYLPMTRELNGLGYLINHKKVYRIMRDERLLCGQIISTSAGKRSFVQFRKIVAEYPLQYLSMDIKFIRIDATGKFSYVLTVIDVYSRVVLNYVFKNSIKQHDVIWLMSSIVGNEKTQGISIRNDNGSQFLANKVRIYLNEMGINQEFTHIATPEENSYIEAFHSIMERELVSRYEFDSFGHAEIKMAQWMHFYNHVRRHGKIKHQTPAQKLANYYKECALPLDFDRPQIAAKPFDKARFFEKEFLPVSNRKNKNCFEKIPYNLDYQIGVANFADQKMMEIT